MPNLDSEPSAGEKADDTPITLPDETSNKFLAAFANSLASRVTSSLIEQLVTSRTEAEIAKAAAASAASASASAAAEEDAKAEKEKDPEPIEPKDMIDSLHKLDEVRPLSPKASGH